jgi:hypothetical protein
MHIFVLFDFFVYHRKKIHSEWGRGSCDGFFLRYGTVKDRLVENVPSLFQGYVKIKFTRMYPHIKSLEIICVGN